MKRIGRVPTPNDHPSFIQGMADLIRQHLHDDRPYSEQLLLRCPFCVKTSCQDARKWLQSLP